MALPNGLEELDLKVYVDYSQERQNRIGPFVFAMDGVSVDSGTQNNCIIDPVTLSVFGKPLPMTPEWYDPDVPATGSYYRYNKTDFTISAGGATWFENPVTKAGDIYLINRSDNPSYNQAVLSLNGGVQRNQAMFFSFAKIEKKNTNTNPVLKLYWANTDNNDKDVQMHFHFDGSCSIYRGYKFLLGTVSVTAASTAVTGLKTQFTSQLVNGDVLYDFYGRLIGTVSTITNDTALVLTAGAANTLVGSDFHKKQPKQVQKYSRTESNYQQKRPISTIVNPNDQFNDVYIIPCRGNSILVLTSFGLNFCHTFIDLNVPDPPANAFAYWNPLDIPNGPNVSSVPIILPSGSFSMQCSKGKAQMQLAKLYFRSNWSIQSQVIQTKVPPYKLPNILDGQLTFSVDSTSVIGTGTLFTSQLEVGDQIFYINDNTYTNGLSYENIFLGTVDSITNDTLLDLVFNAAFSSSQVTGDTKFYRERTLTGTIDFTYGNGAVLGTGTSFTTELVLGDLLYDENGNFIGGVQGIINNTNLVLFEGPSFSGTNKLYQANVNQYTAKFKNAQAEPFFPIEPDATDIIKIGYQIDSFNGNQPVFDNENNKFIYTIFQTDLDDLSETANTDYGIMFYCLDEIFLVKNEKTYNGTVDITQQLESFDMTRTEQGALSLTLTGRKKLLEDAGMVKADITANRSIKVQLEPRDPPLLTGGLILDTTTTVVGINTEFTTEVNPGDTLYLSDQTVIGIVASITTDTELILLDNNILTFESDVPFTNLKLYGPLTIFEGYLNSPEIEYIQGVRFDDYALLRFTATDKVEKLNIVYYSEAPSFDNTNLSTVLTTNVIFGGAGNNNSNLTDLLVSPTINTYQISQNRANSNGQYNFVADFSDTVGGFIEKVRKDFAQNFVFFSRGVWYPSQFSQESFLQFNQFQFLDLSYIPAQSPFVSVYLSDESAFTNGGIPIYESLKRTTRSLRKTYEKPEANRIYIVGLDKSTGDRLQLLRDDKASQNPLLAPANRPQNWLGDVNPFVMISDKLNTATDVAQANTQFFNKITTGRELIEFESDMLTYFDFTTKFIPDNKTALSGTITTDNSSVSVVGFSTLFTTELQVGDTIYDYLGNKLGIVAVINSDTTLDLVSNAEITYIVDVAFNNYTVYKNQYESIDIGDVFYLVDNDGNNETYRVIDWRCTMVKERLSTETLNIRRAIYRAKKVTIPANNPPIIAFAFEEYPASNQWIITQGYELTLPIIVVPQQFKVFSYSLSGQPTGMVIDATTGVITWTPTSLQQNKIFSLSVVVSDGTSTTTHPMSIRTYNSL